MAWTRLTFEDLGHTVGAAQRWAGHMEGDAGTVHFRASTWAAMLKLVHAEMALPKVESVNADFDLAKAAVALPQPPPPVVHCARTPVANSEQPAVPSPTAQVAAAFRGAAKRAGRPVGRSPGKAR